MSVDYEVYVCPGCGDELNVYDIEPSSISDVGGPRREETGNYFCEECERDYEPIPVVPVSKVRERLLERAYAAGGERAREYRLGIRYDEEGFEHRDAHEELPDGLCSADMMVAYAIVKAALDAAFPDKETDE